MIREEEFQGRLGLIFLICPANGHFSEVSSAIFKAVAPVQQVNISVFAGCSQDDVYTFLDLLLKPGRLGMGLCQ